MLGVLEALQGKQCAEVCIWTLGAAQKAPVHFEYHPTRSSSSHFLPSAFLLAKHMHHKTLMRYPCCHLLFGIGSTGSLWILLEELNLLSLLLRVEQCSAYPRWYVGFCTYPDCSMGVVLDYGHSVFERRPIPGMLVSRRPAILEIKYLGVVSLYKSFHCVWNYVESFQGLSNLGITQGSSRCCGNLKWRAKQNWGLITQISAV